MKTKNLILSNKYHYFLQYQNIWSVCENVTVLGVSFKLSAEINTILNELEDKESAEQTMNVADLLYKRTEVNDKYDKTIKQKWKFLRWMQKGTWRLQETMVWLCYIVI